MCYCHILSFKARAPFFDIKHTLAKTTQICIIWQGGAFLQLIWAGERATRRATPVILENPSTTNTRKPRSQRSENDPKAFTSEVQNERGRTLGEHENECDLGAHTA